MPVFRLTLHPTYYRQGFFNVTVDYDGYVRADEGPVMLVLGDLDWRVGGRIDRKANMNGTARILGGAGLRDWFQAHFNVMDQVGVELSFPDVIRLKKPE